MMILHIPQELKCKNDPLHVELVFAHIKKSDRSTSQLKTMFSDASQSTYLKNKIVYTDSSRAGNNGGFGIWTSDWSLN